VPPPKKVKETDAIFANVQEVHQQIQSDPTALRLSLDSKAPVVIGPFSRGGASRDGAKGADHDFKPEAVLGLFGIFRPQTSESALFFTDSKVSSDFMVDCLERYLEEQGEALKEVRKLVLDLDNGPENSGQRSQWLLRLLLLAQKKQWHLVLVYYPPYHSKYNAIERFWGILEKFWNGALLSSEAVALGYAQNMTYNGVHPVVHRNHQEYAKGVRLHHRKKKQLERWLKRKEGLEKWAIEIPPPPPDQLLL
jgi:transposase